MKRKPKERAAWEVQPLEQLAKYKKQLARYKSVPLQNPSKVF